MIVRAPGKLVFWGEYAVLAGAPAGVVALDRYVSVEADVNSDECWSFSSTGFLTPSVHQYVSSFCHAPVCAFAEAILKHWGYAEYPIAMTLHTDSSAFFHATQKLGIGSSAAVCTATYVALSHLIEREPNVAEAMLIHRAWQGGKGSGLDIAASWHGGVIRFQSGDSEPIPWPDDLLFQVVWTGTSASTADHVARFGERTDPATTTALDNLITVSESLADTAITLSGLEDYTQALARFDAAAALNIYTEEHRHIETLANKAGVIYKPCGAGGGDIGIALSDDPTRLQQFTQTCEQQDFVTLNTEIARHGSAPER